MWRVLRHEESKEADACVTYICQAKYVIHTDQARRKGVATPSGSFGGLERRTGLKAVEFSGGSSLQVGLEGTRPAMSRERVIVQGTYRPSAPRGSGTHGPTDEASGGEREGPGG